MTRQLAFHVGRRRETVVDLRAVVHEKGRDMDLVWRMDSCWFYRSGVARS